MKHSVSHDLGKDMAKKATLAAFAAYRERFAKFNPTADWKTDDHADISFAAKGITLKGSLDVRPTSIDIDIDVPFLLRPFKSVAEDAIEREISQWVEKAKRGEI
jgi:Putative polyhydroxyalkanoic acid system protein (PHA_gran_rgn)